MRMLLKVSHVQTMQYDWLKMWRVAWNIQIESVKCNDVVLNFVVFDTGNWFDSDGCEKLNCVCENLTIN